jgi:two-component system, OmpR family, sensor histidine kinase VicK
MSLLEIEQRLTGDILDVTRIGIVPEILPRRFTILATKSIITGGTGLGLFVSKSIVEANGGQIRAKNNKNSKGATFTFSLPVRK